MSNPTEVDSQRKPVQIEITIDKPVAIDKSDTQDKSELKVYFDPERSIYRQLDSDMYDNLVAWYNNYETSQTLLVSTRFLEIQSKLEEHFKTDIDANFPSFDTYYTEISKICPDLLLSLGITTKSIEFGLCIEKLAKFPDETNFVNFPKSSPTLNGPASKCPTYPPSFPKPVFEPCRYPHLLKLYSHFYEHCYNQRNLHAMAGAHYNEMNKTFVAPTLIISALSSIASFIASSEIIPNNWKIILTLSVGVSTSLNALVQSFSSAYQFDTKSTAHFTASDNYDQLIIEIDFEKSYPNKADFFQTLEKENT